MKRAWPLIGLLLAFDAMGMGFIGGHELLQHCRAVEADRDPGANIESIIQVDRSWLICVWYAAGVTDAMEADSVDGLRACTPTNTTGTQLGLVTLDFLREHPELLHYSGHSLVAIAVSNAFPCSL